ncbi:MAG TPA: DUF4139 domain-containing protein [Gammaproteobacteria bacterium]|nr:DUF4139 domain-containing protein [Gammaproteobacteria bacterium]
MITMVRCWLYLALVSLSINSDGSPEYVVLGRDSQTSVSLMIYNNFALVQEVREVVLPKGLVELEYQDVPGSLEPTSVVSRSTGNGDKLEILEQNYRYLLLNRDTLLDAYIGRKVNYSQTRLQGSAYERVSRHGVLLSTDPEIVDFDGEVEISPEGTVSLHDVPEDLNLSPSLVWLLNSQLQGSQSIETSYLTGNLRWQADYVLTLNQKDQQLALASWVTVDNHTGVKFDGVSIQLVAGDINRVTPQPVAQSRRRESLMMADTASMATEAVFEYHKYELPGETDLKNNEKKQIRFLGSGGVSYVKSYHLTSQNQNYQLPDVEKRKVEVRISFENSRKNQLGVPLPAGIIRVYLQDRSGALQFIGEDTASHTPVGQDIKLNLGRAFDITAHRKQLTFRRLQERLVEASYEIEVHNSKKEQVEIIVHEKMPGDWRIIEQSEPGRSVDSRTQEYRIKIPAEGHKTISYRVQTQF